MFKFSNHALEQIETRSLSVQVIEEILLSEEKLIIKVGNIDIYQKIIVEVDKPYLYRVFVNNSKEPFLVVTAYKTSKIEKYETSKD
ncbi:MAG: DUF4258 domain-containing protein [Prolixibacteraceae bacterium]|jgi:hypothetical protein|nr:DUF4258 domain-containing protein [Prolixibacteraceae bacterium]